MAKAKPYFKSKVTYDEEISQLKLAKKVYDSVFAREYPFEVVIDIGFSFAPTWRISFYLNAQTAERTRELVQYVIRTFPISKMERGFLEGDGSFRWTGEAYGINLESIGLEGKGNLWIHIEDASKENCVIRKVKKTIEVFETDCKPVTEESVPQEEVKS